MCGVAGVVALRDGYAPPSLEKLAVMAGALRHRGPDSFGAYRDERAGLAHARLSIIDLATGAQPQSNEDGSLWVVFNGEIFNYLELRDELRSRGHRFTTASDTEVIVHAYEQWGDGAFERFNGQWAVAIWNAQARALVLARDPFGVRPLYVHEEAGLLHFASEVKALFAAAPQVPRQFDPVGLCQVFTFWTTVAPRTVFQGISEIEPGHVVTWSGGRRCDRQYWWPQFPTPDGGEFRGSLKDAEVATTVALDRATRLRALRADVPVGSYLSGGLDSSLIAALGARARGGRLRTFSLAFEDDEYDERRYQRLLAARLESDHQEVLVTRQDVARVFPDAVFHAERPVLRTAAAPMFVLSGLVRSAGMKVVLTGEGADEMFGGYDLFREAKIRRFWARQPDSAWRPRLLGRLYPYMARSPVAFPGIARQFFGQGLRGAGCPGFGHLPRWRGTASLRRLFSRELRESAAGADVEAELLEGVPREFRRWSPLAQDQYLEIRTLLSGYLLATQGDRMMMAHGVEGRFPFLDRDVVALANSLPSSYKLRVLDEKHVLKRVAQPLVPDEILHRRKQPYRAPDAACFVGPEAPDWVEEVMREEALREAGVFDPAGAALVYRKCAAAGAAPISNADNVALVGILSTQLLHRQLLGAVTTNTAVELDTTVDHVEGGAACHRA